MVEPQIQIERISNFTKSMNYTLERQGFQVGKVEFDLNTGTKYVNVYKIGRIVKIIIFENDLRQEKTN